MALLISFIFPGSTKYMFFMCVKNSGNAPTGVVIIGIPAHAASIITRGKFSLYDGNKNALDFLIEKENAFYFRIKKITKRGNKRI